MPTAIDEKRYEDLQREFPDDFNYLFTDGRLNRWGKMAEELMCYRKPYLIKSEMEKGNIPTIC